MALSIQAAKRREYPEMVEDNAVSDGKVVKRRVPITDVFYLVFKSPNDNKYYRQGISYERKVSRIAIQDLRNFEAENNVRPSAVQRELSYRWNETKKMWEDILGAKKTADCYENCTGEYNLIWRPEAYKNYPDPLGTYTPAQIDPKDYQIDMLQRQLGLQQAKEQNRIAPMSVNNTGTGGVEIMPTSMFLTPQGNISAAPSDVPPVPAP